MATSPKKSADSVVARLTDPKNYTGSHVHRFDADGKGRGLAGRAEVIEFKGNTNTSTVESTVDHMKAKKAVVASPIGAQKFGTQASKSAVITLFRNGDKHHKVSNSYNILAVQHAPWVISPLRPPRV